MTNRNINLSNMERAKHKQFYHSVVRTTILLGMDEVQISSSIERILIAGWEIKLDVRGKFVINFYD